MKWKTIQLKQSHARDLLRADHMDIFSAPPWDIRPAYLYKILRVKRARAEAAKVQG